jgi:O-antigen biosynthesis protein
MEPLVTCIMPTRDRRAFVAQAIALFQRQDYPERELLILDDGDDRVGDLVPDDPRIRYVAMPGHSSIGVKRNLACELARGAIVAHWDDDDWYAPHRLRHQVAPLLVGDADLTGLETTCFFELDEWRAWVCSPELHRRLFTGDVHGGTLVYYRRVWETLARYPDASVAEDALFLRAAVRRGARLRKLPGAGCFVYLRHGANAWRFAPGEYLDPAGWRLADPAGFLPRDELPFYERLSRRAPAARPIPAPASAGGPLVTCIMPTCNRRAYVPLAIRYFQRQDYPERELLVLDDGDDPITDLIPSDPRIRYVRLDRRMILGAKRNLACELACGAIILHWDDDDWCAPHRIGYQVGVLTARRADLCGASRQIYYSPQLGQAWLYEYPAALRRWLAGNTLCYRKAFWARNRFPEVAVGEDTRFAWSPQATSAAVTPDHSFYVGMVHEANTSPKHVSGTYWRPHPVAEVERLLGYDLGAYRQREG